MVSGMKLGVFERWHEIQLTSRVRRCVPGRKTLGRRLACNSRNGSTKNVCAPVDEKSPPFYIHRNSNLAWSPAIALGVETEETYI
jgi:hypothetical protein